MQRRSVLGVIWTLLFLFPSVTPADEGTFDSNGVKIYYTDEGKGDPVLLIHGFTANGPNQWNVFPNYVSRELAKEYRVITIDNRGHGRSEKPRDPKKYGLEMVEDQVRLLDHLHIKKAHAVGYSMGAMITAKLMESHPDRLLSATLGGAGALRASHDLTVFKELADALDHDDISPLITALLPKGQPAPTPAEVKTINQFLLSVNDAKALAAVVRSWKDLTVSDAKLRVIQVPTLLVVGEIDPLRKGVDEVEKLLPNTQYVVINGGDHISTFRNEEFLKAIKDFLAKNRMAKKS